MTRREESPAGGAAGWVFATIALGLAWSYLATVLVLGETVFGAYIGLLRLLALLVGGWVAIAIAMRVAVRRGLLTTNRARDIGVLALATTTSLFAADLGFSTYTNLRDDSGLDLTAERLTDAHTWHGELYPRTYYPTSGSFVRFKPGVTRSAATYGEFYDSRMLESPLLRDSVLELREVTYIIDEHGFRGTTPIESARLFVLGDSFAFGFATTEGRTFTARLADRIDAPVYNLGVSATGPGAQIMLLDHLLDEPGQAIRIERLVWLIFEGNDLENMLAARLRTQVGEDDPSGSRLRGTVLAFLSELPQRIKEESLIDRWRSGRLELRDPKEDDRGQWLVDGIALAYPLYHSDRFGYRMFNPIDISRAREPESYVLEHSNRPKLDRAFADMSELADRYGFEVLVVIVPSAARVYGPHFDGFPPLSDAPYFISYVAALAERQGFDVLDLLPSFAASAEEELLYYRDDHHWNERGNQLAADLVASHLSP